MMKKVLYTGLVLGLLFGMGFIYREYMYVDRMAKEYIKISFLYQSMESETHVLKENIHHIISSDQITVREIAYTKQAARNCYEALVEARECANKYIEAQINRPFPPDRISYHGEELLFDGLANLYESSYNLEDGLKSFENALLGCLEDEEALLEMKDTLPQAMEDVEWLEEETQNLAADEDDVKAIVFYYFCFLKNIETQSANFLDRY